MKRFLGHVGRAAVDILIIASLILVLAAISRVAHRVAPAAERCPCASCECEDGACEAGACPAAAK